MLAISSDSITVTYSDSSFLDGRAELGGDLAGRSHDCFIVAQSPFILQNGIDFESPPKIAAFENMQATVQLPLSREDHLRPFADGHGARDLNLQRQDREVSGSMGSNILNGSSAADLIKGLRGADKLNGGRGDDRLFGGRGKDDLRGGAGEDRLFGGSGTDRLTGGAGADKLSGGAGADVLRGGAGADRLLGGKGADRIFADGADRSVKGGKGADQITLSVGAGEQRQTIIDGGRGEDRLILRVDFGEFAPDRRVDVALELDALQAHVASGATNAIDLELLGLRVRGVEQVSIRISGPEPTFLRPDNFAVSENDQGAFDLLANDPGAFEIVSISGVLAERGRKVDLALGELEIGLNGLVIFTPGVAAQMLGLGENLAETFTYHAVSKSSGQVVASEATIVVKGLDDPLIILPSDTSNVHIESLPNEPVTLSGIEVALPQFADADVDVEVSTANGQIGFTESTDTTSLSFIDSNGQDGSIRFSGSPAEINNALANSLLFTPTKGFVGTAGIKVDVGVVGFTDAPVVSKTVEITIVDINRPPSLDLNGSAAGVDDAIEYHAGFGPTNLIGQEATLFDDQAELLGVSIDLLGSRISGDEIEFSQPAPAGIGISPTPRGFLLSVPGDSSEGVPASVEDFRAALSTLQFSNRTLEGAIAQASGAILTDRKLSFTAFDTSFAESRTAELTISVSPTIAPSIDLNGSAPGLDTDAAYLQGFGGRALLDPDLPIEVTFQGAGLTFAEFRILSPKTGDILTVFDLPPGARFLEDNSDQAGGRYRLIGDGVNGLISNEEFLQALRSLTFSNTNLESRVFSESSPFFEDRAVEVRIGDRLISQAATINIDVARNAEPEIDLNGRFVGLDTSAIFVQGEETIAALGSTIGVSDPDSSALTFATITITNPQPGDRLFLAGNAPSRSVLLEDFSFQGSYFLNRDVVPFFTLEEMETALSQVRFVNDNLNTLQGDNLVGIREITVVIGNRFGGSDRATSQIEILVNQSPIVDLDTNTPGDGSVSIFSFDTGNSLAFSNVASVEDPEGDGIEQFAINIRNFQSGDDLALGEDAPTGVALVDDVTAAGRYILLREDGGAMTPGSASMVLSSLLFSNPFASSGGSRSAFADRLIDVVAKDQFGVSQLVTGVVVAPPNTAPVIDLDLNFEELDADASYRQGGGEQRVLTSPLAIRDGDGDDLAFVSLTLTTDDIIRNGQPAPVVGDRLTLSESDVGVFELTEGRSGEYTLRPVGGLRLGPIAFEDVLTRIGFVSDTLEDPAGAFQANEPVVFSDRHVAVTASDGVDLSPVAEVRIQVEPNAQLGLVANDDVASVDEDGEVAIDVLANDLSALNAALSVVSATDAALGTVSISDDSIVYRPNLNASGRDSFSYTVEDSEGVRQSAAVAVDIRPIADQPRLEFETTFVPANNGFGTEQVVNADVDEDQKAPQSLALEDGRMLFVWRTPPETADDNAQLSLRVGVLDGSGAFTFSTEVGVSDLSGEDAGQAPQVIQLSSGEVILTSHGNPDGSSGGVFARLVTLDANGVASISKPQQINDLLTGEQASIRVTKLDKGELLFFWESDAIDGSGKGISARTGGLDGQGVIQLSNEFQVNTFLAKDQTNPQAVSLADGKVVLVWETSNVAQDATPRTDIVAVVGERSAEGEFTFGEEVLVNIPNGVSATLPQVEVLNEGGLMFTWKGDEILGRFAQPNLSGSLDFDDVFRINSFQSGVQTAPQLIQGLDDRIYFTWEGEDFSFEPNTADIYLRSGFVNADRTVDFDQAEEISVNFNETGLQETPELSLLNDGRVVWTWASDSAALERKPDGLSDLGIAVRVLDPNDVAVGRTELSFSPILSDMDGSETVASIVIRGAPDNFVFSDEHSAITASADTPTDVSGLDLTALKIESTADFTGPVSFEIVATSKELETNDTAQTMRFLDLFYLTGTPEFDIPF